MRIEITPAVVVPDVSPLIHLVAVGCLPLLQEFGRVVVMDVVALEASAEVEKPWARQVAEWLAERNATEGRQPVAVVTTEIGEAYRLARQADPNFRLRNAGENAIRDWLVEILPEIGGPALVVYEDSKVPKLLRRERLHEVVVAATTRALLAFAEERGLIRSAEDTWSEIIDRPPSANPRSEVSVMRPRRAL
jgi:hypothetical protein